ncbi:MAG: cation transporter [Anaerolineae bacterium]
MIEFKALHVSLLTEEIAANLEDRLNNLPGVENFNIVLDVGELNIVFDERQLDFRTLAEEMATAGCPWQNINAALFNQIPLQTSSPKGP